MRLGFKIPAPLFCFGFRLEWGLKCLDGELGGLRVKVVEIESLVRGSISMSEENPICHESGMELRGSLTTIDGRKGGSSPSATNELDLLGVALQEHKPTVDIGRQ